MVELGQYGAVLAGTWCYWVSMGQYLVELGQFWAVVADTWWYRVSMGWYWLVHGGTGSV